MSNTCKYNKDQQQYIRNIVKGFFNHFENTSDAMAAISKSLEDIAEHLNNDQDNKLSIIRAAYELE
jgi:hypothetical protein